MKEVIDAVNSVWKIECRDKDRTSDYLDARAQAVNIYRYDFGLTLDSIARKLNYSNHATVINSLKVFEQRIKDNAMFKETFTDVKIILGLKKSKPISSQYKSLSINPIVQNISKKLDELTTEELEDYIPRLDLYIKSVNYNRKQKEKYTR